MCDDEEKKRKLKGKSEEKNTSTVHRKPGSDTNSPFVYTAEDAKNRPISNVLTQSRSRGREH